MAQNINQFYFAQPYQACYQLKGGNRNVDNIRRTTVSHTVSRSIRVLMCDVFAGSHYLDMTLSAQVVDLCRLHLVDDLHQARAVSQIAIMQLHV